MGTHNELKQVREQKKQLLERQRELQVKVDATKEERRILVSQQTEARKNVRTYKTNVRTLSAEIYGTFKNGSAEDVLELAEELSVASSKLAEAVKSFGEAARAISKL